MASASLSSSIFDRHFCEDTYPKWVIGKSSGTRPVGDQTSGTRDIVGEPAFTSSAVCGMFDRLLVNKKFLALAELVIALLQLP